VTENLKTRIARRPVLASLCALFGLGIAGSLIYEGPRLLERRYRRTKYDDLLDQLSDRESAAKLGKIALDQARARSDVVIPFNAKTVARELREGPGKGSLARAAAFDIGQGRLVEVQGWVLPVSEVAVAALAARV
jgi:hypothetical protein